MATTTEASNIVDVRRESHVAAWVATGSALLLGLMAAGSVAVWAGGSEDAEQGKIAILVLVPLTVVAAGIAIADPTSDTVVAQ